MRLRLLSMVALLGCNDAVGDTGRPAPPAPEDAGAEASAAGTPRRDGVLRFATLNVHRYFDTTCDSGSCAPGAYEELPTEAEFSAKTEALAAGVTKIDADVIALEEVETRGCLDALHAKLGALGYVTAELGETGAPASVDVAILARASVTESRTHRDMPLTRPDGSTTTFSRELLELRMTFAPAQKVIMFAAHFRSKVDDDPGRRYAEAVATRDIMIGAANEVPDALVILGGDLNDEPGSPPLDAIEQNGALVRVAKDIPDVDQKTSSFMGLAIAIDHLYVTASHADRYVPKSAGTVHVDTSDHAALLADFK